MFAGLRAQSGELYVPTDKRAIKVSSFNRTPDEERWNKAEFEGIHVTPWEPFPGRGVVNVKSRFMMVGEEEFISPARSTGEVLVAKNMKLQTEDVLESTTTPEGNEWVRQSLDRSSRDSTRYVEEDLQAQANPSEFKKHAQIPSGAPVLKRRRGKEELYQEGGSSGSGSQQGNRGRILMPRAVQS